MNPPKEAVRLVKKAEEMLREADSVVWRDQPGRATGLTRTVKTLETWLRRHGEKSWDEVFADKQKTDHGTFVTREYDL